MGWLASLLLVLPAVLAGCGTGNQGKIAGRWNQEAEAFVSELKGDVEFSRGGSEWAAAVPGLPVRPGTTIRSGPDSKVELVFGNGAGSVQIKPRSTITLERYDVAHQDGRRYGTAELFLLEGDVADSSRASQNLVIMLKTPGGARRLR